MQGSATRPRRPPAPRAERSALLFPHPPRRAEARSRGRAVPGTPPCPSAPPLLFRRFFPPSLRCPGRADSRSRGLCTTPGPPGAPQPARSSQEGLGALGPWGTAVWPCLERGPGVGRGRWAVAAVHNEPGGAAGVLRLCGAVLWDTEQLRGFPARCCCSDKPQLSVCPCTALNASCSHLSVPCHLLKLFFIRTFLLILSLTNV